MTILENVILVLASKFDNFRKLPSNDSRKIFSPHSHLKFRDFSRISGDSSKILKVIFPQGCRNRGGGHLSTTPLHIFSKECENRGTLEKAPTQLVFGNQYFYPFKSLVQLYGCTPNICYLPMTLFTIITYRPIFQDYLRILKVLALILVLKL